MIGGACGEKSIDGIYEKAAYVLVSIREKIQQEIGNRPDGIRQQQPGKIRFERLFASFKLFNIKISRNTKEKRNGDSRHELDGDISKDRIDIFQWARMTGDYENCAKISD